MKKAIQENIRSRVEREKQNGIIEDYGPLVWWICVPGAIVLGLAGGASDAFVLFGIIFSGTQSYLASGLFAAGAALGIQFVMGAGFVVAFRAYQNGDAWSKKVAPVMYVAAAIALIAFGASVYISLKPHGMVEALAYRSVQFKDEAAVKAYYDQRLQALQSQFTHRKADLRQEIDRLNNDKIMWKGKWTTRERSSRKATTLSGELAALEQELGRNIDRIQEERSVALEQTRRGNQSLKTETDRKVTRTSISYAGLSILFNLLRLSALGLMVLFMLRAREEVRPGAPPTPPAAPDPSGMNQQLAGLLNLLGMGSRSAYANSGMQIKVGGKGTQKQTGRLQTENRSANDPPETVQTNDPQTAANPVVNRVDKGLPTEGANPDKMVFNVKIINGKPTLPYTRANGEVVDWTLRDVRSNISARRSKGRTAANLRALEELRAMERVLVEAEAKMGEGRS